MHKPVMEADKYQNLVGIHTLLPSSVQRAPYPPATLISKTTPCGGTVCTFSQQQYAIKRLITIIASLFLLESRNNIEKDRINESMINLFESNTLLINSLNISPNV